MSINSLLNTGRNALLAQQTAIETASHNIANATVEGYTRQRVTLAAGTPNQTPVGAVGSGVVVQSIDRIRNPLLDADYRQQTSQSSQYGMRSDLLTQISDIFSEPSDDGLADQLDAFWNAWGDLANSPTSNAAKSVVQERGAEVASTLNRYSQSLDSIDQNTRQQMGGQVTTLNQYTSQLAKLNGQILASESGGQSAPDLRDQRDTLIDQIAQIVPVQVIEHDTGMTTIYVDGATVVDGVNAKAFSLQQTGASVSIQLQGQPTPFTNLGGALGAMADVVNTDIPNARAQLDQLASSIVSTVNQLHRTGWTQAGDALGGANWDATTPPTGSNVDFFDPAGTTAASISLSAAVASSAAYVAAGTVQNGTGSNDLANTMAQMRSNTTTISQFGTSDPTSFNEYYRDIVTQLGVTTDAANSSAQVYSTLADQANTRRMSISGVSTDEELISITASQRAYAAAAKVVTAADDMAQSLLDMIR